MLLSQTGNNQVITQGGRNYCRYECGECGDIGLWYPLVEDAEIDLELHTYKIHYDYKIDYDGGST